MLIWGRKSAGGAIIDFGWFTAARNAKFEMGNLEWPAAEVSRGGLEGVSSCLLTLCALRARCACGAFFVRAKRFFVRSSLFRALRAFGPWGQALNVDLGEEEKAESGNVKREISRGASVQSRGTKRNVKAEG